MHYWTPPIRKIDVRRIVSIATMLILFNCKNGIAESTSHKELVHFSAHFGLSYAINSTSHAFLTNILGVDNTLAIIASNVFTFGVGALYKVFEIQNGKLPGNFGRSMIYNSMGIGFSDLTILTFDLGSK